MQVLKAVVAQFNASQLITQRTKVRGWEEWREMCVMWEGVSGRWCVMWEGVRCSDASPPQVSVLIRDQLIERAKDFSIILDDVSIVSGWGYQTATHQIAVGHVLHSIPD